MSAFVIRRTLFMIAKIPGVLLVVFAIVQFAPGGPVSRVIAKLSAGDGDATSAFRVESH